jgi:hypothetical protein
MDIVALRHGHKARACSMDKNSMDMQQRHAAWICIKNLQLEHEVETGTCSMVKRHGQTADVDMRHGHEAWTCSIGIKKEHAEWTCTMENNMDMQHRHSTQHQLGHAALTWSCNIDMDMQH